MGRPPAQPGHRAGRGDAQHAHRSVGGHPAGRPGGGSGRRPLPTTDRQRRGAAVRAGVAAADPGDGAGPGPPTGGAGRGPVRPAHPGPPVRPGHRPGGGRLADLAARLEAVCPVPGGGGPGDHTLGGAQLGPTGFTRAGHLQRLQRGRHLLPRRPTERRLRRPGLQPGVRPVPAGPVRRGRVAARPAAPGPRVRAPAPQPGPPRSGAQYHRHPRAETVRQPAGRDLGRARPHLRGLDDAPVLPGHRGRSDRGGPGLEGPDHEAAGLHRRLLPAHQPLPGGSAAPPRTLRPGLLHRGGRGRRRRPAPARPARLRSRRSGKAGPGRSPCAGSRWCPHR